MSFRIVADEMKACCGTLTGLQWAPYRHSPCQSSRRKGQMESNIRAQSVDPDPFPGVDHRKFARHRQNTTLNAQMSTNALKDVTAAYRHLGSGI